MIHSLKKIVTIVGARPQFIKAAPLSLKLKKHFKEKMIHTGQHYDFGLSEIFFNGLNLPKPDYNLEIGSGRHGWQTARMLEKIEAVLVEESPELVIVFGDTNSTLAGALAADKLNIPVAHIEAGLRSYNKLMPEETNRILTDHISDYLFVPSENSREILEKENLKENVFVVGDIMYDSLLLFSKVAENIQSPVTETGNFFIATIHRAENTDKKENLESIFNTFSKLTNRIVFPVHPRTAKKIKEYEISIPANVKVIEPLGYIEMIKLAAKSKMIFTDSGGLQKEAYYLGVPCITLRNETEWTETVSTGWNRITGTDEDRIINAVKFFNNFTAKERPDFYGKGNTSELIVNILLEKL